jgi:hypothetical protein
MTIPLWVAIPAGILLAFVSFILGAMWQQRGEPQCDSCDQKAAPDWE